MTPSAAALRAAAGRDDFVCAICQHPVDMTWEFYKRARPDSTLPPFCRYCEQRFSEGIGKPTAGSFRDRREVVRGFAIAEALHAEAGHRQWRFPPHGAA